MGPQGASLKGRGWHQDWHVGRRRVCVYVCKALCTHTCVLAGHGGESLVFRAEGPEAEKSSTDLKTHEGSSLPGVCWVGGQSMWDPRHSPRRTSQAEFGV